MAGDTTVKRQDSIGAIGYNELLYPPWLSRLLVASSVVMACGAGVAAVYRQPILFCLSGLSAAASINYWRRPGPGSRRDADYLCAAAALLYTVPMALSLHGWPNACFWLSFTAFYLCFRRSFQLSVGDGEDGTWAQWHGAGHTFVSLGTASAAAGDVDGWRFDKFNPLGTLVFAVVCTRLAYDTWKSQQPKPPHEA